LAIQKSIAKLNGCQ